MIWWGLTRSSHDRQVGSCDILGSYEDIPGRVAVKSCDTMGSYEVIQVG